MKMKLELKTCKSYDCLNCAWQSNNKPYKMRCLDCGSVVESHKQNKPSLIDRPTPVVQAKTAEEITIEKFIELNNYQPFELWPDLTEVIQHAASHWKTDREWSCLLEQINKVCIQAYHAQFTPSAKGVEVEDFQSRVLDWLIKCFGIEISKDITERSDRFLEESLELVQSLNYTPDRAHALVDYVFSRDKGEPFQECGGVMVTLAALCSATGLNMAMDGETEFARINKPEIIEKIRKKQASKPVGSALPQVWQQQKQAETISRLREILEELANINSTSPYHQELRVKAFGILNPTPTNKDTQNS